MGCVALYEKLGFKPVPGAKGHYDRCNLLMEADLTSFPPQAYLPDDDPRLRTALLLSGGVDSALALHRLCSQGVRPDVYYIKIGLEGEDLGCTAETMTERSRTKRRFGRDACDRIFYQKLSDEMTWRPRRREIGTKMASKGF